jgi:hypothetical protein
MDLGMNFLLTEENGGGLPFRVVVSSCGPDMRSRLQLLGSLLEAIEPDRARLLEAVRIRHEPTGRPVLEIQGEESPFVSFSRSGAEVWAALSGDGPVGIDAARSSEFRPPYPFRRVFNPNEWQEASLVCRSPDDVAPLLWTLKEAAVKALGCGFGDIDPLDVENLRLRRRRGIIRCGIGIRAGGKLHGAALRRGPDLWIGVAWLGKETVI